MKGRMNFQICHITSSYAMKMQVVLNESIESSKGRKKGSLNRDGDKRLEKPEDPKTDRMYA